MPPKHPRDKHPLLRLRTIYVYSQSIPDGFSIGKASHWIHSWYVVYVLSAQHHILTKPRPEHFSTPIAFAQQHFGLDAELIPVPTGTGDLTKRLKTSEESQKLDVAIGLTEGFVADLGKSRAAAQEPGYGLVGTYVESPLRWAISTGKERADINAVSDLEGKRVGVSRIGR